MAIPEKVFFSASLPGIIDFVMENGRSHITGEDLAAIRSRYPDAEIIAFDEAVRQRDDIFKEEPIRISKEKFIEMLEVLPPLHWRSSGNSESFKLSEFTCGSITAICCRIGDEYWQLKDHYSLSHEIIVDRCRRASIKKEVLKVDTR